MELILIFYVFLLTGFGLCLANDVVEKRCTRLSPITILSLIYLVLSIPFYCNYTSYYKVHYLFFNLIFQGLFIFALIINECEEVAVVFYGVFISIVLLIVNVFLVKTICNERNDTVQQNTTDYLSEFDDTEL